MASRKKYFGYVPCRILRRAEPQTSGKKGDAKHLVQIVDGKDALFRVVVNAMGIVAQYLQHIRNDPRLFQTSTYWQKFPRETAAVLDIMRQCWNSELVDHQIETTQIYGHMIGVTIQDWGSKCFGDEWVQTTDKNNKNRILDAMLRNMRTAMEHMHRELRNWFPCQPVQVELRNELRSALTDWIMQPLFLIGSFPATNRPLEETLHAMFHNVVNRRLRHVSSALPIPEDWPWTSSKRRQIVDRTQEINAQLVDLLHREYFSANGTPLFSRSDVWKTTFANLESGDFKSGTMVLPESWLWYAAQQLIHVYDSKQNETLEPEELLQFDDPFEALDAATTYKQTLLISAFLVEFNRLAFMALDYVSESILLRYLTQHNRHADLSNYPYLMKHYDSNFEKVISHLLQFVIDLFRANTTTVDQFLRSKFPDAAPRSSGEWWTADLRNADITVLAGKEATLFGKLTAIQMNALEKQVARAEDRHTWEFVIGPDEPLASSTSKPAAVTAIMPANEQELSLAISPSRYEVIMANASSDVVTGEMERLARVLYYGAELGLRPELQLAIGKCKITLLRFHKHNTSRSIQLPPSTSTYGRFVLLTGGDGRDANEFRLTKTDVFGVVVVGEGRRKGKVPIPNGKQVGRLERSMELHGHSLYACASDTISTTNGQSSRRSTLLSTYQLTSTYGGGWCC